MRSDMDFEERKMEYDFNKFCRESCEEILSKDESVKWRKSEIIYSDLDHSLVRFDGKDDEKDVHIYFRVFHSENDDRYEAVPVVLKDDKLIEGIEKNKYDLIIAREAMFDKANFTTYLLTQDELVVTLSSNHRFSQYNKLTFYDIADEDFILMNPYTSIYQLCINELKNHNINANIIKTARTESILGSVSINEGISLLPKSNFEVFHRKNINTISLDPSIKLSVVLAKHKSTKYNFSIKKFIDFVEDFKSEL